MQFSPAPLRECADCYYRVDGRCRVHEVEQTPRTRTSGDTCEMFTRASLRFAFFPKM